MCRNTRHNQTCIPATPATTVPASRNIHHERAALPQHPPRPRTRVLRYSPQLYRRAATRRRRRPAPRAAAG
eukprot:222886-Chlamydomonas_euryale.AAC.5